MVAVTIGFIANTIARLMNSLMDTCEIGRFPRSK